MTVRPLTILAVGAFVLLLGGCVPAVPMPGTSSGSPSPTSTRDPTPSPDAAVVTPGGLGELRMGQPVPAGAALVAWNATACVGGPATDGETLAEGDPYAGQWITTLPGDPSGPLQPDPFRIATADGTKSAAISAIEVFSPKIMTDTGIHVGSTVSELTAAYPSGFVAQKHGLYTNTYAVAGPTGTLLFEAYDGSTDAQGSTEVALIWVLPPATAPFTTIPGDGGLGCGA